MPALISAHSHSPTPWVPKIHSQACLTTTDQHQGILRLPTKPLEALRVHREGRMTEPEGTFAYGGLRLQEIVFFSPRLWIN